MGAAASYGSFGTRRVSVYYSDAAEEPRLSGTIGGTYSGSQGDFTYYDDRGTPYNLDDDREVERANNRSVGGSVLGRLLFIPSSNLRLTLLNITNLDSRGVPGLGQFQSSTAERFSTRSVTQLQLAAPAWISADTDLSIRVYADYLRQGFDGQDAEIGLGQRVTRGDGLAVGGTARVTQFFGDKVRLDGSVDSRHERF
ncbi:MAG: hypothetical protein KC561_21680, partial [Myxococcales bacterium]|nr:hypothetical protein [Myxococcales bacterium]